MLTRSVPLMGKPEDPLLARCRRGDLEAFAGIHAEHEQAVFRHALRLLGCRDDALDVCQETFVSAFAALARFRGECTVRVWLLRICTNRCRDRARSRGRRRETSLESTPDELAGGYPDPAVLFERDDVSRVVWAALDRLPVLHREIILLRDFEDLSFREVAAVLGCAVASVPVKLFRARKRLRDEICRLSGDEEPA
jgi:RNA polymerase sigma-70 factor, ECF subfamily